MKKPQIRSGILKINSASVLGITLFNSLFLASSAFAINLQDAFSPHQGATALVVKAIGEAKGSIHVAAYSFTSEPIGSALVAARARGVDVEVVCDKSDRNGKEPHYMASRGIPIRINYHYAIMHNKFMVIDGTTLELGSFNYTAAAESKNAENVLVIHDAGQIAIDYEHQWQKLWLEAEAL